MNAMERLQQEVGEWAMRTFPGSTDTAKLKHLEKELDELKYAQTAEEMGAEAADCFLILLHFCDAHGIYLYDEAVKKHGINKRRKWGAPDKDGVIEHIR